MKGINCRAWCLAAMSLIALSVSAEPSTLPVLRLSPEELTWTQYPNGVFRAEISGDEKGAGVYVYRVRFPSGFRNQPHFHPDDRIVTVLSGTIFVGFGEEINEGTMKALPQGSIWTEPKREAHYVWAKKGEVVIQVFGGNWPSGTTPVKPKE